MDLSTHSCVCSLLRDGVLFCSLTHFLFFCYLRLLCWASRLPRGSRISPHKVNKEWREIASCHSFISYTWQTFNCGSRTRINRFDAIGLSECLPPFDVWCKKSCANEFSVHCDSRSQVTRTAFPTRWLQWRFSRFGFCLQHAVRLDWRWHLNMVAPTNQFPLFDLCVFMFGRKQLGLLKAGR